MTTVKPQAPTDNSEEIVTLIETLHQTGKRLEQLTGGEVDSVVNRDGQTFLLQHVQEQLHLNESARQAAILDALPASIALLDGQGRILSVNESWQQFGRGNAAHNPGRDVGDNYLAVCDEARGEDAAEASEAAAGIRKVLDGEAEAFTLEYPCHSPAQQCWFLMTVTPLAGFISKGAVVMHLNITANKLAENALRESETQYRLLVTAMNEGVVLQDENTAIIASNKSAERILGHSADQLMGKTSFDPDWRTIHEDGSPFPGETHPVVKTLKTGIPQSDVTMGIHKPNGELTWIAISAQPIFKEGQTSPYRVVATMHDITERRRAEIMLRESEEEFHTLAEAMPQIVWITSAEGMNTYFNQHWVDYTGLTLEESRGDDWYKPFHPDDRQQARDAWQKAIEQTDVYSIECRLRGTDGSYRWWLVRGVPLIAADGSIQKWFGTCTDIHDLKMAGLEIARANGELRESERRFSDLLENVELVAVTLDREARITYCNDYLLRLTGWMREEVIGKNWWDVFMPAELAGLKDTVFAKLLDSQPEALHHENDIVTRSGERRLIRWSNSVLRSAAGDATGTASIGEDITEREQAEARIEHLNRVLLVMSSINTLIVRVNDREELLAESCNIAVEAGGFRMAMLVIVDPVTKLPVSVTSAGKNKKLRAEIEGVLFSSEAIQRSVIWKAIRGNNKAIISNVSENDPRLLLNKHYTSAGIKSMAVMPLVIADESVGALALYSREIDFFQEDEMKLLSELADDIAFAIDHIDKQERLNYLAYFDELTGFANRTMFLQRAAEYMRNADNGGYKLALGLIDLERFKNINDSLGRQAGDVLLKQVAQWLTNFAQDEKLLARIDADHFAFVLPEINPDKNLTRLIDKFANTFQAHAFRDSNRELRIVAKTGIAIFPDDGTDAETVYGNAEAALKSAKTSGHRYLFHTEKMTGAVAAKLTLENQLYQAIEREEFVLYYQPKVNLVSGKVSGAEALIRWNDPLTGLVPPGKFIPVLEETGLIYEVGRWALRQALTDWLRWRETGLPAMRVAVNVSSLQLRNANFINEIRQVDSLDGHASEGLELEITETLIMQDIGPSTTVLEAIRALGITIAIDDFGTGFSSLSYLAKLPVDTLKIDRSFVIEMNTPEGLALVSTIIILAHSLKLKVVAEGVETEDQKRELLSLGCDEMQGFLFCKPVPPEIFEANFLAPLALDEKQ